MADETPQPEAASEKAAAPAPDGAKEDERRRGTGVWAWIVLALLVILVGAQISGVLLRDRLERRQPLAAQPPPSALGLESAPSVRQAGPEPSRFGPEVQEVVVVRPPTAPTSEAPPGVASPAAPLAHGASAPPDTGPASSAAPPASKTVAPPVPTTTVGEKEPPSAAKGAPAVPGSAPGQGKRTHALLVDVFLSQKYLRESEQRLKEQGLPTFRVEFRRKGGGLKVAVTAGDRDRARKALEESGVLFRTTSEGCEAYFYYRHEAQGLVDALAKKGISAAVSDVDGERPYWKLYAGPFAQDEARAAQKRLADAGVKSTLEVKP